MSRVVRKEILNKYICFLIDRASIKPFIELLIESRLQYLSSYLSRLNEIAFLHLFLGSIFMSLIRTLDMLEQHIS